MDIVSKKDQANNSSDPDALAQPLELRESLKIRDGLGGHDARPVRWPQLKTSQLTLPDLGYIWVSNN